MNRTSDEKLLSGLNAPEKSVRDQALKQLYAQHFPVIAAYINKNNGTSDDAADIFQDGILVFYEKVRLKQLDLNCSIQTYLYSVCRNLWLNRLRVQKRQTPIDDDMLTVPVPEESLSVIAESEKKQVIMALMEKLGEDCKKVLTHYYFDRLRMKEIASAMGFATEQVAKNKKAGCMKRLKSLVLESPRLKSILK